MSRIERVRALLAERELDAALVTHPANRFYLSGFPADDHGPDESAGLVIVDRAAATLIVSPTDLPWAEAAAAPGVAVVAWERPWTTFLGTRLKEAGHRRVGFEERALSVGDHAQVAGAAGEAVALLPLEGAVDALRAEKAAAELDLIERAIRLTDAVFVEALGAIRPGLSERALAWRIERLMREAGADAPAFPTIVAAGEHAARPHHAPTERPIGLGEPVIIDMGARVGGYNADLTRTVLVGEPPPRFASVYNTVLAAQEAALGAVRAGMSGKDADGIARGLIDAAGHGDQFLHGLGHGLGIKVHEAPSLGKTSEERLRPGQVVTVEPGIYLEGWGGVRIEDVGVVEASRLRRLTTAPKALADIVVPTSVSKGLKTRYPVRPIADSR